MLSCGLGLGVAAVQLAVADDALRLGADVDEDLVLVDAHDGALDDVAVLEAADLAGLLGEQLLHRRRLGAGRHRARGGRGGRLGLARGGLGASAASAAPGAAASAAGGLGRSAGASTAARAASPIGSRGLGGSRRQPRGASAARAAALVGGRRGAPPRPQRRRRPRRARRVGLRRRLGHRDRLGRRGLRRERFCGSGLGGAPRVAAASALLRRWLSRSPSPRSRGSGWGGSSATATVPRSARWPGPRLASAGGCVPPCCSSVKSVCLLSNAPSETRKGPSTTLGPSVCDRGPWHGGLAVRSFEVVGMCDALLLFRPAGPAELPRTVHAATIGAAVPELPDLAILADALHARSPASVVRAEAPAPLVVRGTPAELAASSARRCATSGGAASSSLFEFERDRIAINAMLTGRFRLAAPGDKRPQTAVVLRSARGPTGPKRSRRVDARGALAAGRCGPVEVRYRDPTPDGQGLPAARRCAAPVPASGCRAGPGRRRPGADARRLARRGSGATRASSRTCCGTRRSSPASATPTATRSCARRGCARSGSAHRWRPRRSMRCTTATRDDPRARDRRSCASGSRRRSRSRSATSSRSISRAARPCPRCGTRLSEVSSRSEATTWCRGCQR